VEPDIGTRIRDLREAAQLRASDLAEKAGLDPTALSKIENGRRSVKTVELARIAMALNVSPLALLEPESLLARLPIAARKAGSSIAMGEAYNRLVSLSELHVVLADGGIPTSPNLAGVPSIVDLPWLEGAESLAEWARTKLSIPPSGDERFGALVDSIETVLGLDVLIEPYQGDALSGAAITDPSFPLLFVNSSHAIPRALFTLAHELGHVLARHDGGGMTLDRELAGSTEDERLANAFAASFLMPADEIKGAIEAFGRGGLTLVVLSHRLGVSFESLIYRLHNLREINAEGRDKLMAVNWHRMVLRIADEPDLNSRLSRTAIGQLQSRSITRPGNRLPAMLVRRANAGYLKGVVSVQALASLSGVDADELREQLQSDQSDADAMHFVQDNYAGANDEAVEELFAGSPF
jgi:Zn-dependent peptidase ImmA (M78 family)/DNA-binding XRE family transcriptional regulator